MAESESVLLRRFTDAGDAGAFAEIVRRYAGLVYGTCLRVLADTDKAADATQETFFQLMNKADAITGSLASWLHRVAVHKAIDTIRADSKRRRREQNYIDARSAEDLTWKEISPHVDEALNEIDEDTRDILVRHYLGGRSMTDLAEELGTSRATVSRRIDSGLALLRSHLHKRGVLVATVALAGYMTENTAQSAPAALLEQLGRMAIFGAEVAATAGASGSSSAAVTTSLVALAKTKLAVATAVVVVLSGAALVTHRAISSSRHPLPARTPAGSESERSYESVGMAAEPAQTEAVLSDSGTPEPELAVLEAIRPAPRTVVSPSVAESVPAKPVDDPANTQIDLSSPGATVRSFTKAIARGDAESVLACFLPGGEDYGDMNEILAAGPDHEAYAMFRALDPDTEMATVSKSENPDGSVSMVWQVTFRNEFSVEGYTFHVGDTYDMDATLVKSGDSWLIENL